MVDKKNEENEQDDAFKIFEDPLKLGKILQSGIHAALIKHMQMGNPICKSDEKGDVIWIPAEQILSEINKDVENNK